MKIPGLSYLTDKWVLIGLALGAGVYYFTSHKGYSMGPNANNWNNKTGMPGPNWANNNGGGFAAPDPALHTYYPHYDVPGEYETGIDFNHMRFSGQAELQRRLTVV